VSAIALTAPWRVASRSPRLEPRDSTARRIGAETTEVQGSHVVFLTQPAAVAEVIDAAARGAAETLQGAAVEDGLAPSE